MAKEIYIDKSDCVGCENCMDFLPGVFKLGSDGASQVIPGSWGNVSEKDIKKAMRDCSGRCIEWK